MIEAATGLPDKEGGSGPTFRALSACRATGPGALYRYVAGRRELLVATSALLHHTLGAAGQHVANRARASSLGPETEHEASTDAVTARWRQPSAQEYPCARAVADRGLDHDDRGQFLAGIDLIAAGSTSGCGPLINIAVAC